VTGPTGPIAVGPTGPFGPQFEPARTLFVAQSWPAGADPLVFFTSIQAAINQAATLNPVTANHVNVVVFAGTYNENLTLVSNVNVMGMASAINQSVNVLSATWLPAQGLNAPQANLTEGLSLSYMTIPTFTSNSTGKGTNAGNCAITFTECSFNSITCTGRAGASSSDNSFWYNCNWQTTGQYLFTDMNGVTTGVEIVSTRMRDLDIAGDTTCRIQGGEVVSQAVNWSISGTAQMFAQGINLQNSITVTSTAAIGFTANGCKLLGTLSVAAGSTADIRDTNYSSEASLIGPGAINRSTWNIFNVVSVAGANVVALNPPYPDTNYTVLSSQTAGAPTPILAASAKTAASFTFDDSVGGNTFDFTIVHD
jgi:hypothetical protein